MLATIIDTVPEVRGIGLVKARITGIFTVSDPFNDYWVALSDPIVRPLAIVDGRENPIVLLIEPAVMLETIADANAGLPADFRWHLFVDSDYFKELRLNDSITRLTDFEDRIGLDITRADVLTVLESRLQSLQRRMLFARIPMAASGGPRDHIDRLLPVHGCRPSSPDAEHPKPQCYAAVASP